MKRTWVILLHLGFWFIYFMVWLLVLAAIEQGPGLNQDISFSYPGLIFGMAITPSIYSFYLFYFWLFPDFLQRKNYLRTILLGAIVALSSFLIAAITLKFSAGLGFDCYAQSNYIAVVIVSFISFLNGCIAFIIRGFITWFEDTKIKEALLKKNHEMELALIKAQLDPHFLFNTLNNIDILMIKDAERASNYLKKLSDIMRFMLFETKTSTIPISKELDYIQKYVTLQKIRTSNPSYVNLTIEGDAKNKTVAPFVFIPFIENAFKHTQNKKLENAIVIDIRVQEDAVYMRCENRISSTTDKEVIRNGMGNELIIKRLDLLYPDRYTLTIDEAKDKYVVTLNIEHEKR